MKSIRIYIYFLSAALLLSCGKRISEAERFWNMSAEVGGFYTIPCYEPYTDDQIKWIVTDKITMLPYDSAYICLCPRRSREQYAVTYSPTLIIIRLWGKRRLETSFPHCIYDPYADSVKYLSVFWTGHEPE